MEKRFPINFRAFLIAGIAVILSELCVYLYTVSRAVGIVCGCSLLAAATAAFAVAIVRCRRGKAGLRVPIGFALALVFSLCTFAVGTTSCDKWRECERFDGYFGVYGRVCAVDSRSGEYRVELDGLQIDGENADGKMLITVLSDGGNIVEYIDVGDRLSFSANIVASRLYGGGTVNGTDYRTDTRYRATVGSRDIAVSFGSPRPLESFLSGVRELLVENMGDRYGNVAYSMLTGDKHSLYSGISDYYTAVGLGHIMAVSGLHIGFVLAVLGLLLSRLNKRISVPIMAAVVCGYVVIADFSPSVVRAAIMAAVSGATVFFGGRRDLFSSLLCAMCIILAVKPLYAFDVGFLLSFGALGGIALFANGIRRALASHKVNDKIGSAVGASVSVSLGILPVQMNFFGSVQPLAAIVNIVLLPFITLSFVTMLLLLPIAAIPGCGAVLVVSKGLFAVLDYAAYGLSLVPLSEIRLYARSSVYACYAVMFLASEFFMMRRGKRAAVIYAIAMCAIIIAVSAV